MYKCCIFDLDGTLLNTIKALQKATNLTMERFGLGPLSEDQIQSIVGDGYKMQMKRALKLCGDKDLVHYEEALPAYMEIFGKHCMYQVAPYDGILQLLQAIKERRIKAAVFSNKPHVQTVENITGIFGSGMFDLVRGQQEGVPKKPDPAGVYLIMEELGVTPGECLYFGDTGTDMQTGKNAGLDTVGVLWGFRKREELELFSPEYLIETPQEAIAFLDRN
ncbi:MAG: HAD family hydrolase [Lachnospiraceae bacterium]|jgi:phosphoglycolate phosphatase